MSGQLLSVGGIMAGFGGMSWFKRRACENLQNVVIGQRPVSIGRDVMIGANRLNTVGRKYRNVRQAVQPGFRRITPSELV
jgi:hypothetical protein